MKAVVAALALSALVAGSAALAEVGIETVRIERKSETVDIAVTYPRTGIAAIDTFFADWATGMVTDIEEQAKEDFASFKEDNNGEMPPWTYSLYLDFSTPRNDAEMLVFNFDKSIFTGGAHPNHDIDTFNFMMPDAWQVYLPEIFNGKPALDKISALAVADLSKQLLGPDSMSDSDWLKSGAGPA